MRDPSVFEQKKRKLLHFNPRSFALRSRRTLAGIFDFCVSELVTERQPCVSRIAPLLKIHFHVLKINDSACVLGIKNIVEIDGQTRSLIHESFGCAEGK